MQKRSLQKSKKHVKKRFNEKNKNVKTFYIYGGAAVLGRRIWLQIFVYTHGRFCFTGGTTDVVRGNASNDAANDCIHSYKMVKFCLCACVSGC